MDKDIENVAAAFPEISLDDFENPVEFSSTVSPLKEGGDSLFADNSFVDHGSSATNIPVSEPVTTADAANDDFSSKFPDPDPSFEFQSSEAALSQPLAAIEPKAIEQDSEAFKKWKSEFQERIAEIDRTEEELHKQVLATAKKELERFYAEYEEKKKRNSKSVELSSVGGDLTNFKGNSWEKVYKYIDMQTTASLPPNQPTNGITLNGPAARMKENLANQAANNTAYKDASRMKVLLQELKNDPNAPVPASR